MAKLELAGLEKVAKTFIVEPDEVNELLSSKMAEFTYDDAIELLLRAGESGLKSGHIKKGSPLIDRLAYGVMFSFSMGYQIALLEISGIHEELYKELKEETV